jgi:hypothetical protein
MKIRVTWPNGDVRDENSYKDEAELVASMFSNGILPEGVKVVNLEAKPAATPVTPALKAKSK